MDRRESLKWVLAAGALPLLRETVAATPAGAAPPAGVAPTGAVAKTTDVAGGYGSDPDLIRNYRPGDVWPLTLTPAQRLTAASLSDLLIPGDAQSPSASGVGIVDFLDEWLSAPYEPNVQDRRLVLDGLAWLDGEAQRRFAVQFAAAHEEQQHAICDAICYAPRASAEFAAAAAFFARYRDLVAGGFYSTPAGRLDIGYVGNQPLAVFDAPAPELLRRLGLSPVSP